MKTFLLEISIVGLLLAAILAGQNFNRKPMREKIEPIAAPISSVNESEVASGASEPRSPEWPRVRADYLKQHPECAACGWKGIGKTRSGLQVHHVIPFGVDANGDVDSDGVVNELDPDNLITLCGPEHRNHHLDIGHGGNYRCRNLNCREDAERFRKMRECKVCD